MVEITKKNPYDEIAPIYSEYSFKRQKYLDSIDNLVIEILKPDMQLLDLGSGDGRRLSKILKKSKITQAIAIEPSFEMAKICRQTVDIPVYQVGVESLDMLHIGRFDVITALWNVLGHIQSSARLTALKKARDLLKPGGYILLDVNNRHNANSYGKYRVLVRKIVDTINFKESRGDTYYTWKIGGSYIPSYGHLFTPAEITKLANKAHLQIIECFAVDYSTGMITKNKTKGQLFYKLSSK